MTCVIVGRRFRPLLALAGAVLIGAAAQPASAQDVFEGMTAAQLFDLADARRSVGADNDAATLYTALTEDDDPDIRAEARYRHGLMLADKGDYAGAAVLFRALLDEKPDAVVARLELARMLAAMGREGQARRELRQAEATGIPQDAAAMVDGFSRALRSRKKVGGMFEVAIAPDSNINRATEARTLDTIIAPLTLSDDARAKSGAGFRNTVQLYARHPIAEKWSVLARGGTYGNWYRDSEFNDASASALAGLERTGEKDRVSVSLGHTWRWFGNEPYATTSAVAIDWTRALSPQSQLVTNLSISEARYESNPYQNGQLYDLGLSYERALSARTGVSVGVSATRNDARDAGYATWSGGLNLGAWRETPMGTVFGSTAIRRTEGDERLFLFPERRKEWLTSARVGITMRRLTLYGFAPTARVTVERNSSTVGLYDYRRVAADFGISRAF